MSMLYKRASSALRDGRHRLSHKLVVTGPRGSASPAADPAPHPPPRPSAHPAARSCAPVSMRSSSSAFVRRIRWAGRHLTWAAFNQLKERVPLVRPRLRLPYRALQALVVL